MTSLRQRMTEDMQIRNLSVHTQTTYKLQVSLFARYFHKSPELLGPEEIRAYQIYLTNERKLAVSSVLIAIAALRFLYRVTLKKDWRFDDIIPAPKKPQTLPVVLSPEEVLQFLNCVANVFRRYGTAYRQAHEASLSLGQRRVMTAIEVCRTAALGAHVERCDACGHRRIFYNSCRNRHCPTCQSLARAEWIEDRQAEILDTQYFHVVFTVPEEIAAIAYQNKRVVYGILFQATAETLRTIAADPKHLGAELGFFAVLHTWGQTLTHHPHLHCVIAGGGLSPDGRRWIPCRNGFFLPVRVLSRLFRRLFLEHLRAAFNRGQLQFFSALQELQQEHAFARYLAPLGKLEWVVYAKRPFAGPQQVLDYVGRYTHRVAISNNRLLNIDNGHVSFRWKDYRDDNQQKTMNLSAAEFMRRFLLHVLPNGFQRIRYYGFLSNRYRQQKLAQCRQLLGMASAEDPPCESQPARDYRDRYEELTGSSLRECPACHQGRMVLLETLLSDFQLPAITDTS